MTRAVVRCGLLLVLFPACGAQMVREPAKEPAEAPPERSGSALLLDLSPSGRPHVVGDYGFDVLDAVDGTACVSRNSGTRYWIAAAQVAQMALDPLTEQAVAAAELDAVARLEDADSIVLTRVVAEGKGNERVCAHVYGRGVRIRNAEAPPGPPVSASPRADDLSKP